jgi:hypothetical protein
MGLSHVSVATGANFDALAGAALCRTNGTILLLAANGKTAAIDAMLTASTASQVELGHVLGTDLLGAGIDESHLRRGIVSRWT